MSCALSCGCQVPAGALKAKDKWLEELPEGAISKGFTEINCGLSFPAGGDEAWAWKIDLTGKYGLMVVSLQTYTQKDRMLFWIDKKLVLDTGCVGTNHETPAPFKRGLGPYAIGYELYVPKAARRMWIEVRPNCEGGRGTAWALNISCPNGQLANNDKAVMKAYRSFQFNNGDYTQIQPDWS
jgi:hypothetical protein|nr:MAG TPA: hypothetical protein [Caudoviricetes sp.]